MRIRTLLIALPLILALVAGATWAFFARGRGRALAEVRGQVRELTPTQAGLLWIEAAPQPGQAPAQLRFVPHDGATAPVTLLEAYDIRSFAVRGEVVYALLETAAGDATGQLVSHPLGGGTEVLVAGLHSPQGLIVTDTALCWTESRAAPVEGVPQVPIMGRLTAIRTGAMTGGKMIRESQPRLLAMAESAQDHYTGQLIGARAGSFYWTELISEQMPGARTYLRCASAEGGEAQTIASARGVHQGALGDACLYWTDYSDEMAFPGAGRTVRRRALGGGDIETLTDWLPPSGVLATDGDRAYYEGAGWLWSVPLALDKPRPIRRWGMLSPGELAVYGGNAVGLVATATTRTISRQPLSLRGYMTAVTPGGAGRAAAGGGRPQ